MALSDFKIKLKKKKDRLIEPIVMALDKMGFTADRVTLLSVVFGLAAVYFINKNHFLFISLILSHFLLDILDGSLARWQKKPYDPKGIWLDYLGDRVVILALFIKVAMGDIHFCWSLGLYLAMQLFYAFFYLRKNAKNIKNFLFLDSFMIGAFIFKLPDLVLPIIMASYFINIVIWLSKRNDRPMPV